MQKSPVQIGSIDLQDFEIPESLRFGGRQRLAVHALAGGKRIVERLGPDDDDIQFHGTFSGPTAESRVRAFENLRLSGAIIWLTWESFRRQVIVKSFIADYASPWWIHYRISCVVVYQARTNAYAPVGAAAILAADMSCALSMASASGVSLAGLQATLSNTNALIPGTADQNQAIAAADFQMQEINNQVIQQSIKLDTADPANSNPADLSQSFVAKVSCAQTLAAAANIRGYVGRLGTTLAAGSN